MKLKRSEVLDLYTDYLIATVGTATATGLSEVLDGAFSHDMVTRLLSSGYINSRHLWYFVKPMCMEIGNEDGVLIIDDSVEAKPYTDNNELIQWHFDHTQNRSIKGVNFVTGIYNNWQMSLPIGVNFVEKDIVYTDPKTGKQKCKSSISKQTHFRDLVRHGSNNLRFRYVLSDSWFACGENMDFIVNACGRDFIMAIKDNRKVALSKQDKEAGKYVSIKNAVPEGCVRSVWVEQLDFPILIARQVFKDGDGVTGTLYLACSDLSLSYEQITTIYKRRWKVEAYHKSIKSNTAFPKSPTKRVVTQKSHFVASIMAYVKMERLKVRCGTNHFALKSKMMVNATKMAWITMDKLSKHKYAA